MSRILFITTKAYDPYQGSCHRTRHTLESLLLSGYQLDLLAPKQPPYPELNGLRLRCIRTLPFCHALPAGPSLRRFVANIHMLFHAVALAHSIPYKVIHGVDDGGIIAWLIAVFFKTPFIFDKHAAFLPMPTPRQIWAKLYQSLERRALKKANTIICNDPSIIAMLSQLNCHGHACLIPDIPSINTEITLPARHLAEARYRTHDSQKLITCISSAHCFQGLDLFFNAIPQVLTTIPQARFIVVGGTPTQIKKMQTTLEKNNLQSAVCFPGYITSNELAALLASSDVLVAPRRNTAATPIYILDYLSSRTPIVAADTTANRKILSPDNALIMRPLPESLADGIIRLCRSPAFAIQLGQNGYDTLQRGNRTIQAFRHSLCHCYQYTQSSS